MKNSKNEIAERTFDFSLAVIACYQNLPKNDLHRILGKQILRCGTSVGANVHEAQAAQSKADFIAKMSIAHKEARETAYWLRLFQRAALHSSAELKGLADEVEQIIKMLSAILLTSKKKNS
jgi:four helix bundle protein